MPKATIVVPVYNVEQYLKKCVTSVLNQTERDFELLLVDDGSTDSSGDLCDRLAQTDPRIRVIHQKNQGLGGARNTGIREAAGEWLLLIDSDDWIDRGILEHALKAGTESNADLVVFGFRSVDEKGRTLGTFLEDIPKNQAFSLSQRKDILLTSPCAWCRLYRTNLFRRTGIKYPPKVWYEDIRTTPKLLAAAEKILFLNEIGYNYLQRQGSIMQNKNVERNGEILDAFGDLLQYFQEKGLFDTYQEELCYLMISHAYIAASVRVLRVDRHHPLLRWLSAALVQSFPAYQKNPYLSRLGQNKKLIFSLLEKQRYGLIALLFRIKG